MTHLYKYIYSLFFTLFFISSGSASVVNMTDVSDTYIASNVADTNYGGITPIYMASGNSLWLLLNFSTDNMPTSIDSAELYVYCSWDTAPCSFANPTSFNVSVVKVTSSWTELGVTWNTKPTFSPSYENTSNVSVNGYQVFNITSLVRSWLNGSVPNYGIMMNTTNDGGALRKWIPKENITNIPYIKLTYSYPSLISPANSSALTKAYPPLTSSINFTWFGDPVLSSNLLVAKDSNFNLIAIDTTVTTNYLNQSLEAGNYWWKVRYYNSTSGTYSSYSNVFNFTLTNTQTTSGTAIQGTVYELIGGLNTPIDGATVYISSAAANWSSSQTVGSNGYYLFTGLTNSTTYYLSAKASGYDDSVQVYVTTGAGTWVTQNIPMTLCISGLTCYGTVNYVKFVATDFFGNLYNGLSVNVYKGSDVTTTYTATTGSDGSATFRMTKDQSYRLVFTGSTITSTTITVTPGESTLFYVFVSTSTPPKWWDNTTYQEVDTVRTGVTTGTSGGVAYVNVTYNDSLAQTTVWTVYLNQTNHTQPNATQTKLQSATGSGNFSTSFSIASGYAGESYLINIVATHTTFGTIKRSFGVQFYGTKDDSLNFIPSVIMAIIAIAILVFVGAFFDSTNFAQGSAIICTLAWIELGLGMFSYFDVVKIGLGIGIASVIAVIANMNERNKKEITG